MAQIEIISTGERVVFIANGKSIILEDYEVLQYRKFLNNTFRFCNEERFSDLPVAPSNLTDILIDGAVPSSFTELDTMLAAIFPALPSGSGGGASLLQSATVELTDAQIKALPTTGVEVVAAPGAGKFIQVVSAVATTSIIDPYGDITDASLSLIYDGGAASCPAKSENALVANAYLPFSIPETAPGAATFDGVSVTNRFELTVVENKPLLVSDNWGGIPNYTGGNAANTLKVTVYYVVVDL